jgi:hypothetical protein
MMFGNCASQRPSPQPSPASGRGEERGRDEAIPLSHLWERAARRAGEGAGFPNMTIKRSKFLIIIISILFSSTVLCLWLSGVIILLKVIFSLMSLSFYLLFLFRMYHNFVAIYGSLTPGPASRRGEVYLQNNKGEISSAILRGDSYISRFLLILNFKIEGRRFTHSIIILPDALDKSSFRQLRAHLLLQ